MNELERAVWLVSGIPGAGKSTVSRLLAAHFARGVHIESDLFQRMIVTGGRWPNEEPQDEAQAQLDFRNRLTALVARSFFEEGFTPVVDQVVIGKNVERYQVLLRDIPLRVVLLTPTADIVRHRDAGRALSVFETWGYLDEVMRSETPRRGLWLDSSSLTAAETVSAILRRADEARL